MHQERIKWESTQLHDIIVFKLSQKNKGRPHKNVNPMHEIGREKDEDREPKLTTKWACKTYSRIVIDHTYANLHILFTLSERLLRISGTSRCNLDMRSSICSLVIPELPDCLERDLLLDILMDLETRNRTSWDTHTHTHTNGLYKLDTDGERESVLW